MGQRVSARPHVQHRGAGGACVKVVVVATGETEKRALPGLLERALRPRTQPDLRVRCVSHRGLHLMLRELPAVVARQLAGGAACVVAIADLSDPQSYPEGLDTAGKADHLKRQMAPGCTDPRVVRAVAVWDLEAWLLSEPEVFEHQEIQAAARGWGADPEMVDHQQPPGKRLEQLFPQVLGRPYQKIIDGARLFRRLTPEAAYRRCGHFRTMIDDIVGALR
ncbi:MAG: DUF4276 family protein [Armatimonadia bacterium]|nr:DUF4276 family protein [Armatimonadia bacterium]